MTIDKLLEMGSVPRIAYFSMEIAVRPDIPTYSGGLGILAGDLLRSAADLGIPFVGVTLVSRAGYFRQEIVGGAQHEHPQWWDPAAHAAPLPQRVAVTLEGREVFVRAWLYMVCSPAGGEVPVLMLDTDLPENASTDREITNRLYGGDPAYRLKQEWILGVAGVRLLTALGLTVREYHMNEGHSAFAPLEVLRTTGDEAAVRERFNFTTHTPVEAGHDKFSYELAAQILGPEAVARIRPLAGTENLNTTRLALSLSKIVNGVAKKHAEVSQRMFPGYEIQAITNGVHPRSWTSPAMAELYDRHLPEWWKRPEALAGISRVPDDEVWQAHNSARERLVERVRQTTGVEMSLDHPILGFARRMTGYKRPELLFADLDRLRRIAGRTPFQIVLAGKAHPRDIEGKRAIEQLHQWARELSGAVPVAYIPDYDMEVASLLVAGSDLWLNTPLPPLEASGTSGMKAAFNGVPSLSTLDGWWIEGFVDGLTGWAIRGMDSGHGYSLYRELEERILPMYHHARHEWIGVMKGTIARNASFFHTHRALRDYRDDVYRAA